MVVGKQQVLFQYLPGKVFDHREGAVARVTSINGTERSDVSRELLLQSIRDHALAWPRDQRPSLPDAYLSDVSQFVFVEPDEVASELFPLVFWCQNASCGHAREYTPDRLPPSMCPRCKKGKFIQLPFVLLHECGRLVQWSPPACPTCHSRSSMALQRRGSQVSANSRWWCLTCNCEAQPLAGFCSCNWSAPTADVTRMLRFELFRVGRAMYPQSVTMAYQPGPNSSQVLSTPGWQAAAASIYFNLPLTRDLTLEDWCVRSSARPASNSSAQVELSTEEWNDLLTRLRNGEFNPEQMTARVEELRTAKQTELEESSYRKIAEELVGETGLKPDSVVSAGQELLETLSIRRAGANGRVSNVDTSPEGDLVREMGIAEISVVTDFPVTTAVYGYTRGRSGPNECWLNAFPRDQRFGRIPVYTDVMETDAVIVTLDAVDLLWWLERLGYSCHTPGSSTDATVRAKAYFLDLFDGMSLRETVGAAMAEARLAFGALHSLAHYSIRQAALLCGLDITSMSEYLLPRTLTFAIFCNHQFGAKIGALISLFEQTLPQWLESVRETTSCIYDPVCSRNGGACHACSHLAETSCRYFNLNLGRPFLFGGVDQELGSIDVGFFAR